MILELIILGVIVVSFFILITIQRKDKLSFPIFLLTSLVLAIVSGLIVYLTVVAFNLNGSKQPIEWIVEILQESYITDGLSLVGNIFTSLMKMLIAPLVFSAIFRVVTKQQANSKKVISFTLIAFVVMVAISSLVALLITLKSGLGTGIDLNSVLASDSSLTERIGEVQSQASDYNFFKLLESFLPSNIINDLANNNMIAIIIFALIFAICLNKVDIKFNEQVTTITNFIDGIFEVFAKMIDILLGILPYSIYALILNTILAANIASFKTIGLYIFVVIIAMLVVFILQVVALIISGVNIKTYFKTAGPALLTAFSTASSNATLPVAIESLKENGVKDSFASIVPTLGTTMGMAGCGAVYPTVITVMSYISINGDLPIAIAFQIILIVVLASFGMQGVPGTAMYAAILVLTTLNLPLTGVILVASIDFFVDMVRTTLNVNGAMSVATIGNKVVKD